MVSHIRFLIAHRGIISVCSRKPITHVSTTCMHNKKVKRLLPKARSIWYLETHAAYCKSKKKRLDRKMFVYKATVGQPTSNHIVCNWKMIVNGRQVKHNYILWTGRHTWTMKQRSWLLVDDTGPCEFCSYSHPDIEIWSKHMTTYILQLQSKTG